MTATCERDGNPRPISAYLCPACVGELRTSLSAVAGLLAELDVALARQARIGERGPRSGTEQPLPYSPGASAAADVLVGAVGRAWAAAAPGEGTGAPGTAQRATWLAWHVQALCVAPTAAQHADEVSAAVAGAQAVIDRPADRAYAGICWAPAPNGGQCAADLYGVPGEAFVTCAECGARHDAARRRAWLLEQVDDQLAHASVLAAAVTGFGAEVTSAQIRGWAFRGRIEARGTDRRGRPLYRVGDVLDALQADITKRNAANEYRIA